MEAVLEKVRFGQLGSKFLQTRVLPELSEIEGSWKSVIDKALLPTASQGNRSPRDVIYVFGGQANTVNIYDEKSCACVPCPEMPLPFGEFNESQPGRAIVVNGDVFLVSKYAVEKFNPVIMNWKRVGEGEIKAFLCLLVLFIYCPPHPHLILSIIYVSRSMISLIPPTLQLVLTRFGYHALCGHLWS